MQVRPYNSKIRHSGESRNPEKKQPWFYFFIPQPEINIHRPSRHSVTRVAENAKKKQVFLFFAISGEKQNSLLSVPLW
jgi:hypothetical protein